MAKRTVCGEFNETFIKCSLSFSATDDVQFNLGWQTQWTKRENIITTFAAKP